MDFKFLIFIYLRVFIFCLLEFRKVKHVVSTRIRLFAVHQVYQKGNTIDVQTHQSIKDDKA